MIKLQQRLALQHQLANKKNLYPNTANSINTQQIPTSAKNNFNRQNQPPSSPAIQKRMFHSSLTPQAPQKTTVWDTISSWFKPMTTENLIKELDRYIYSLDKLKKMSRFQAHNTPPVFDKDDLHKAIQLIDKNKNLINNAIKIPSSYNFLTRDLEKIGENTPLTIADYLLTVILKGDRVGFFNFQGTESTINIIKLLNHTLSIDGKITPERKQLYQYGYLNFVIPELKNTYANTNPHNQNTIEIMTEIVDTLKPILQNLMADDEIFIAKLKQEELIIAEIKSDINAYQKKAHDIMNREDFLFEKIKKIQKKYVAQYSNRWGDIPYPYELPKEVRAHWENLTIDDIDENEYQAWLKNNKQFNDQYQYTNYRPEINSEETQLVLAKKAFMQKLNLNPPDNPSHKVIIDSYHKQAHLLHPDKTRSNTKISQKEINDRENALKILNSLKDTYVNARNAYEAFVKNKQNITE